MVSPVLTGKHFQDETAAFAFVEAALWPNGPVCPHCGEQARVKRLEGSATRPGLFKCNSCRKQFTVRMGTIFESSHLALHLWLQVIHLMCASKKGISTRQVQRMLNCSMKTAWFLTHRIREAMAPGKVEPMTFNAGSLNPFNGLCYCCPSCGAVLGAELDPIALKADLLKALKQV
jgi:transposase-like protein